MQLLVNQFQKTMDFLILIFFECSSQCSAYQRRMPSASDLKRLPSLGFMGMRCLQSGSSSRALFIQLTNATFSSSENRKFQQQSSFHKIHCTIKIFLFEDYKCQLLKVCGVFFFLFFKEEAFSFEWTGRNSLIKHIPFKKMEVTIINHCLHHYLPYQEKIRKKI